MRKKDVEERQPLHEAGKERNHVRIEPRLVQHRHLVAAAPVERDERETEKIEEPHGEAPLANADGTGCPSRFSTRPPRK